MTRRVLTIEVDPAARRIVTALGRRNSPPSPEAKAIAEKWAQRERLEIKV